MLTNSGADIKQFRGIATRYCKLAAMFTALPSLVCWTVNTLPIRRGPSPYTKPGQELPPPPEPEPIPDRKLSLLSEITSSTVTPMERNH